MTQCTVCRHEDREAIDGALASGQPYRSLAERYDLTKDALARHRRAHLSPAIKATQAEREAKGAATAADRVEALYLRAERVLEAAEDAGAASVSLQAIRELRQCVELLARITGELDERPVTVNVLTSPEWLQIRGVLLSALEPHPEARAEVAGALAELEATTGGDGS